ncbi:MAG: YgdI/YgdR family lipoprotein [Acidimicrobiia bacterium]|nr:YgdI/YgdR family lipoprotein [Acidimicrobiia bacterium]
MKKLLFLMVAVLALGACSGATDVVTVDGVTFDVDDVPLETDASTIDMELFREAINWLVFDHIVVRAAEDEFGLVLSDEEIEAEASALLAAGDERDPRNNLPYLRIQARIGPSGLLGPALLAELPDDVPPFQWANEKLGETDVEVNPRFGEWRVTPNPGIYGP